MEVYFKNLTPDSAPEKLLRDLNALKENTEELFRFSDGRLAAQSRDRFLDRLERVKAACRQLQEQLESDEFLLGDFSSPTHGFPYATMGIVFGLGILAGALARRR